MPVPTSRTLTPESYLSDANKLKKKIHTRKVLKQNMGHITLPRAPQLGPYLSLFIEFPTFRLLIFQFLLTKDWVDLDVWPGLHFSFPIGRKRRWMKIRQFVARPFFLARNKLPLTYSLYRSGQKFSSWRLERADDHMRII